MTLPEISTHLVRITNCLQTILDLEPVLSRMELGDTLTREFVVLKTFLEKIDTVDLSEEDVDRIERATAGFLAELQGPMGLLADSEPSNDKLQ